MGDILHPLQQRLLRQTFLQVLIVVLTQAGLATLLAPSLRIKLTLWTCAALALTAWLSTRSGHRRLGLFHFGLMQAVLLLLPWFLGGVRAPAAYFGVLLLHPLALLFGMRVAWGTVAVFAVNIALLVAAETKGRIAGLAPSPLATMTTLTGMVVYTLFFIASPLVYVRRLLDASSRHLAERRAVNASLAQLSTRLEERVGARSAELIEGRRTLQALAQENAGRLDEEIGRLNAAVALIEELYRHDASPRARRSVERIGQAQARLRGMHESLLRFCRLAGQAPRLQAISSSLHQELVRSVWDELGAPVRFSLGSLPGCMADPDLLRHVWLNLLSNAIKYSSRAEDPSVEVFGSEEGICVRDNGIGFDPGRAENLFGLFQRLHPADEFKGTGVGLAIVHRVLEMHGGSIRAESFPGRGATFRFALPPDRRPESALGLAPVAA